MPLKNGSVLSRQNGMYFIAKMKTQNPTKAATISARSVGLTQ